MCVDFKIIYKSLNANGTIVEFVQIVDNRREKATVTIMYVGGLKWLFGN
jgi:hypothetical protein